MEIGSSGRRMWSWARSEAEADERRNVADQLVGQRIRAVRYYTIDYLREELHPELTDRGPGLVEAEAEWHKPTWLHDGFDAMDFGLEVLTVSDAVFSLTWDPPGDREGIGLQPVEMLGSGVAANADVAIWEVSMRAPCWQAVVGQAVTGVDLHYLPWDDEQGSLWCPRITFLTESGRVEVVMGDAHNGLLVPSADNVAVLHGDTPVPPWSLGHS